MIFYSIPSERLPRLTLYAGEHLYGGRLHTTRILKETLIYCLTDGKLELESGGERVLMQAGDVHIFSKGEFQRPIKADDCRYFYFHFSDSFSEIEMNADETRSYYLASRQSFLRTNLYNGDFPSVNFSSFLLPKHFSIKSTPYAKEIKACFNFGVLNNSTNKKEHYDALYNINAAKLFYYLHNTYSDLLLTDDARFNETTARRIMEYIDSHIAENISGERLERAFGYSFDHINRNFKKITGETVFSYLKKSRISLAKQLLYTKNISVGRVAEMTGFCDIYHFSKVFKTYTGLCPTEYIKSLSFETSS